MKCYHRIFSLDYIQFCQFSKGIYVRLTLLKTECERKLLLVNKDIIVHIIPSSETILPSQPVGNPSYLLQKDGIKSTRIV